MPPRPNIDRLPPHATLDEQATIGCQMIDPHQCIPDVFNRFSGDVTVLYDLRHQTIQTTLFEMWTAQKPIDIVTLQGQLRDRQLLEQVGGISYLNDCQDMPPSTANLPTYLDAICKKHMLRRLIVTCTKAVADVYDSEEKVDEILERFERDALAIRKLKGHGDIKHIREIVTEALADIETMWERKGQISGLSTGLSDLDKETDGLHGGDYILIAAFPSVGKTSLAMNIVEHVTLELGFPVAVFSAEMSAKSLVKRAIASTGRVNMRDIRDGKMTEADLPRIQNSATRIAASNLHIDDTSDMSIQQVRAKARRMHQQHGIKLFVADYAQMFSSPGAENHTMELDQVSKGFKNMAKELNVPVIVLSQLTEDAKGNVHLKGARALGEDADGYWQLKRPKDAKDDASAPAEPIELWLRKQRNEARNVCINLTFLKTFTRFEQQAKAIPLDTDHATGYYSPE